MEFSTGIAECVNDLETVQERVLLVQKRLQRSAEGEERVKVSALRLTKEREELVNLAGLTRVHRKFGRMLLKTTAEMELKAVEANIEESGRRLRSNEVETRIARQEVEILEEELSDLESKEATASLTVAIKGLLRTQPSLQRSGRWLCFSTPTSPLLQQGPQCGLVALTMAVRALGKNQHSVSTAFQLAKERGFSKLGELFSVDSMASLAVELLPECKVDIVKSSKLEDTAWVVNVLLTGSLMLVPYDCTPDHSPGLAGGQKAHWALVTGFMVRCSNSKGLSSSCLPILGCPNFYELPNTTIQPALTNSLELMLVARQSKSVKLGLWRAQHLALSCENLRQAADKRLDGSYVLPEDGNLQKLSGRIVILSKQEKH